MEVIRTCIGCNQKKNRSQLVRILSCFQTNAIEIQPSHLHSGRSCYLCYNEECLQKAIKNKRFAKKFKKTVSTEEIFMLERIIKFNKIKL